MKSDCRVSKISRKCCVDASQSSSTGGEKGVGMMPPDYGIGFVDSGMEAASPVQLVGRTTSSTSASNPAPTPNRTGLPDQLKSGIENLSGYSMDDVRVHYNSSKPSALNAHAYAQGTEIHLGAGQEGHLPHEAWHVVQQKQGRVKPTLQMKSGVGINDDVVLEREADVMGAKALQRSSADQVAGGAISEMSVFQLLHAPVTSNSERPGKHRGLAQQGYASDLDQMGVSATTMSNEAFAEWKETAQCKMGLHGACRAGDKTIVTQFKDPSQITQLLSSKMKAGLVMAEGALTFIAGIVAIVVTASTGQIPAMIPAIMTTVVGALKFGRGLIMWKENSLGKHPALIDALRALEAAAALVGAAFLDPSSFFKIPLLIFGVAKAVRSLATAITDWMGEDTGQPIIRKGLMGLASLAHALEVAALAVASPVMIAEGDSKILGGLAMGAVAISKGIRTVDQSKSANQAPWGRDSIKGDGGIKK